MVLSSINLFGFLPSPLAMQLYPVVPLADRSLDVLAMGPETLIPLAQDPVDVIIAH